MIKNFPGGQKGDLPLEKGQVVVITKGPADKKWWRGHIEGSKESKGIFPRACIELIEEEEDLVAVAELEAARVAMDAAAEATAVDAGRLAAEARVREAGRIAAEEEGAQQAAAAEVTRAAAEQQAAAAAAQAKAQARLRAQALQEEQQRAEAEAAARQAKADSEAFAAAEAQAAAEADDAAEAAARHKQARPRRDSDGGSSVASSVASISSRRKKARVVFDFDGDDPGDLTLAIGQVVLLTKSKPGKNWWRGYLGNDPMKTRGSFPASFVEVVEEDRVDARESLIPGQARNAKPRGPAPPAAAPGNSALRSALVSAGVSPGGVSSVTSVVASLEELEGLDYAGLMTMGLRLADRSKITAMRESLNQPPAPALPSGHDVSSVAEEDEEGSSTELIAEITGTGKLGISFDVVWDEDRQVESEDLMIAGIAPGSLASVQAPQLTEGLVLVSVQGEGVSGVLADDVLDLLRECSRPLRLGFATAGWTSPQ